MLSFVNWFQQIRKFQSLTAVFFYLMLSQAIHPFTFGLSIKILEADYDIKKVHMIMVDTDKIIKIK